MDTLPYSTTNLTISADYHNAAGQVYNTVTPAWESWTSAHYNAGDYSVSAGEEGGAGNGSCRYSATTPTGIAGTQYSVTFRKHVDGTAANDVPIGSLSPTFLGGGAIDIPTISNVLAQLIGGFLTTVGSTTPATAGTDWQPYGRYLGVKYYFSPALGLYAWTDGTYWYITSTAPGVTLPGSYFKTASGETVVGPYTNQGSAVGTPVITAHGNAELSSFQPNAASAQLQQAIADALKLAPTTGTPGVGSAQAFLDTIGTGITGVKLASDGLDSISITAPTGRASNFRQMLVQLYRRFFNKVTFTGAVLQTYGDDNTTVVTSQAATNSGGTQSVNAA